MLGLLTNGNINQRLFFGLAIFVMVIMLMPQTAHAAGSAMPWEGPLTSILQSIEGIHGLHWSKDLNATGASQ